MKYRSRTRINTPMPRVRIKIIIRMHVAIKAYSVDGSGRFILAVLLVGKEYDSEYDEYADRGAQTKDDDQYEIHPHGATVVSTVISAHCFLPPLFDCDLIV